MIENSYAENKVFNNVAFYLFFLLIWFVAPAFSIFGFLLLLWRFDFGKNVQLFILLLVALSFGLIGYTTQSVGVNPADITRYTALYDVLSRAHTLNDFMIAFLLDGGNNILFYFITFCMTRIFPHNPQVLPLFWVTVTYFFCFLTVRQCCAYFKYSKNIYMLLLIITCIGIITFYTTTEIIKQCASVSILGYAIMLRIRNKKYAWLFAIIALTTHISSFMCFPAFYFCTKRKTIKYVPFVFVICLALSFFNFNDLLYGIISLFTTKGDLIARVQAYENVSAWTISIRFYAVFAMYFLIIVFLWWDYSIALASSKIKKQSSLIMHSLAFFVLLLNLNNVHNFIRYTLGYFPFYIIAVAQLFSIRMEKKAKMVLISLTLMFYLYSNIKMLISNTVIGGFYDNSYMNNNLVDVFTTTVPGYLSFKTNN